MKIFKVTVVLIFSIVASAFSQQHSLTVVIRNVKETKGKIAVALFNSENDFTKKGWKGEITTAIAGEVQVTFNDIPNGEYAISVMHDANENNELDSNAFGIPKEGFGFSNDAMGMFGPPSFEKAKFNFSGQSKVTINLKYM